MSKLRLLAAAGFPVLAVSASAQPATSPSHPTAVYVLADHHTSRFTRKRDFLAKINGVCQVDAAAPALICAGPPAKPEKGREYFYTVVLLRDLQNNLYLAACASPERDGRCEELRAGQTFSAEAAEDSILIVIRGEQLPLRIFEFRPPPVTIDSPTQGTPSQVQQSAGTPSQVPYSREPFTQGSPSNARSSEVAVAAGSPSEEFPSTVSKAVVSPTSGRLYLYCPNSAASVYVDDQPVGHAPVDAPVLPGRHTVVVRADGFRVWTRTIDIPRGGSARLTAELRPDDQ